MERQLGLHLEDAQDRVQALSTYLRPLKLGLPKIKALCLLSAHGEKITHNDKPGSQLQISKERAGKVMRCAPNTVRKGMLELEAEGVVGIRRDTRPWTYYINWQHVSSLEPQEADPVDELNIWTDNRSRSVTLGHEDRVRERDISKVRVPCTVYRDPCTTDVVTDSRADDSPDPPVGDLPWQQVDGRQLTHWVKSCEVKPLRRLYDEGVRAGWFGDCEDSKLRFLTICHHAATAPGVRNPAAVLTGRCKDDLRVDRIRHEHEQWAAAVLRKRHAVPGET